MGITIKAARVNKGLTQHQAATKLGISPDTLSNYERGKTKPGFEVLHKMVAIYGVPFESLSFEAPTPAEN